MKLKDLIALSATVRISIVLGCIALIFARYSIGFKISDGLPPLVKAASQADQSKALSLLEAGYFVDQPDEDFNVALHYATMLADDPNSLIVFKELLKNYASGRQQNYKGVVPLHGVGEVDDLNERMYLVRSLILHGANIHERDRDGFGVLERIIELIDNTGLQMMLDHWGWLFTPEDIKIALERAKYYNHGFTVETVETFRQEDSLGANKNNFSDLVMGVLARDIAMVERAMQEDPQSINKSLPGFKFAPLHIAVVQPEGHALPIVSVLIKNGADVGAKDYRGATPLLMLMHNAGDVQRKQLIAYLVQNGADINARDDNKDTILHLAVKKNTIALVKFLVENFPELEKNKKNNQGKTPKELARELDYGDMYKLLR